VILKDLFMKCSGGIGTIGEVVAAKDGRRKLYFPGNSPVTWLKPTRGMSLDSGSTYSAHQLPLTRN
jgi:hypothetical protein